MLSETVFRSDDLPAADRFDCWRELVSRTHAPLELRSDHRADFRASQRVLDLGAVSVWPTTFQPVCFRRSPKLIRQSDPEGLHVSLPLSGALRTVRGEEEAEYGPDSLCVVDTSRTVDVHGGDGSLPHTGVGLEVPKALLPLPRNRLDHVTGLRLSVQEGFGALLRQLLTQLARGTDSYRPADGPRLGSVVVDLLSALFAQALEAESSLPPETRQETLVLRIRAFVRDHLHDPNLTPGAIAAANHISRSYLYRLFEHEEESIAAWIRGQRLEGARRDLAEPALGATPIHAIAARWGFPRAADFTRAFRSAYGIPPRDYRQGAQRFPE
ncbi:helix-turn-helix domain-containing protein [Streptomyces sp. NBC_01340]|uniref:AraC-like ligand-binding domain-containing protein n=1 Tax=unclassified Streptomyces TaxID=2593676 RepID=UPI0022572445|nr:MULTISPECIES: helix-turn-helix domain-containing protein [unclassified Streptomyces]MCX4452501.1 helix-turn-helix domain-containing protein [Streptomyces sp. NBC_01719]MCX4491861.1 helix-turn-helix domain-containing protein [Streptomyces sp. NBC_01728]WSI37058.1 helix-turn-helix domain-containing protein [Streptomyces sp. NBC_01340]